ncbi:MAG: PorP/SprF family type IX secretion system membrane protein [Bacteroidota bacterium]
MKKVITIWILILICLSANAQEPFFSQFYNASYLVNPAFTGTAHGYVRVGANYKSYFNEFEEFNTSAVYADLSLLENDRNPDYGGVGMTIIRDQAGRGISNTRAVMSFAYHNAIGRDKNEFIAFGMQAGIDNTNIDLSRLTTQNQWVNGLGFDPTLSSGETIQGDNSTVLDLSAGFMWYKFFRNGNSFNVGVSGYHLSKPNRDFLGQENPIQRRLSVHGSARFSMSKTVNLAPSFLYWYQGGEHTLNPGTSLEFAMKDDSYFSFGIWVRNLDVLIGAVQIEYSNFMIGASYDYLVSSVADQTRNGGYELSISYLIQRTYKKRARVNSGKRRRR